jgi:hypothetical protein
MKRTILVVLAALAVLLSGARQARADGITYTESDLASGVIGTTSFTNAPVTITFAGDTLNVTGSTGLFLNNVGTAAVTIDGIGTFLFTDSLQVFDSQLAAVAGINDITVGDILDTIDSSTFGTYDLTTATGPITGTALFNLDTNYGTSGGALTFNFMDANSTFTATTTTPVPEPSSLLLLGVAIAGLVMVRYRRLVL